MQHVTGNTCPPLLHPPLASKFGETYTLRSTKTRAKQTTIEPCLRDLLIFRRFIAFDVTGTSSNFGTVVEHVGRLNLSPSGTFTFCRHTRLVATS